MSDHIRQLVRQIHELEDELSTALYEQKTRVLFRWEGGLIRFTPETEGEHRRRRMGLLRWLAGSDLRNALSAPFVYALIVPIVFYDLCLTAYQAICFRLYRIPQVKRENYIKFDRHHLGYLNSLEKLNCVYCAYANGLLAYATEISARTEQYWCPIKHAHKVLGTHKRYSEFLDYGDAEGYETELAGLREAMRKPTNAQKEKNT
jgi:hypothetical protein